jgi:hypothetical protein
VAGWSVQEVGGLLTFLSTRGYEAFNGEKIFDQDFSAAVNTTVDLWDRTYPDRVCAVHHQAKNELWASLPDRDGGNAAVTVVLNYNSGNFFLFAFHETPTGLTRARDSSGEMQTYVGTSVGSIYEADSGTADGATAITAYARLNWMRDTKSRNWRELEIEYEAPTGITLTVNLYEDFKATALLSKAFAGATPATATDRSLRRPMWGLTKPSSRAKYVSVEFTNAGAVGDALKVNFISLLSGDSDRKGAFGGD